MAWTRAIVYSILSTHFWVPTNADYVWPNKEIDELERILFEQDNPFDGPGGFANIVKGCTGLVGPSPGNTGGRSLGAEWLRNAYHDMSTADVFAGTGGLDASIVFETDRPENVGEAFSETLDTFLGAYTTRSSMADLFAIAAILAVGACSNGKVIVPLKGGRIDATGPGPSGVPQPQEDLDSHTATFAKQGFNVTEMITLVACGHSIGGVHGVDFPEIVPNPPDTDSDNTVTFDTTTNNFDNLVAVQFVTNVTQNPLAFGQNETTRSDARIFNADGGDVISHMADSQDFFLSTCNTMFERMLNTVPRSVTLTDVINPAPVKPRDITMTVNADGTITLIVVLRIIDTLLNGSESQVILHPISRSGKALPKVTGTIPRGFTGGCEYPNCGPSYTYYQFNSTFSAQDGISSFTAETIDSATGKAVQYNNGGAGFPFSDAIQPIFSLSNQSVVTVDGTSRFQLNITAAVLNAEDFTDVSLIIPQLSNITAPISPWTEDKVHLKLLNKIPGTDFTLYAGTWTSGSPIFTHPFDIVATGPSRTVSSLFNAWSDVPTIFD